MVAEPTTLPGDHGARLDEDENISPARPGPGEPRPEEAISDVGPGSPVAPPVDGELVAQGEYLELEGGPRAEASANGSEKGDQDGFHGGLEAIPPRRHRR